jgi:Asp-tRNA(Asn)/Glu-tRNA(Gln) amidotransferase A subunit family amidase
MSNDVLSRSAVTLRDQLADGTLTAEDLVRACLDQIAAREPLVQAWAWIDPDYALQQARALDAHRASGKALGRLHGLPVGLKDVIDTAGIPTENGTPIHAGRVPDQDAWIVARLRAEGAIIMGKTVTTEVAYLHPNKTRNPHNPEHTPGGSSSGSAAAVAACMVPLAIGTQTGGSVIRPASYNGVVGFKPTFGMIPRPGVLLQSHTLDTLGVFAQSVADCALLAEVLAGFDPADDATRPSPAPRLSQAVTTPPPAAPRFALLRLPGWDAADADMTAAIAAVAARLGAPDITDSLPDFSHVAPARARINFAEMAHYYAPLEARDASLMSPKLAQAMVDGRAVPAPTYLADLGVKAQINAAMAKVFAQYDAVLCPASPGPAPYSLASTGDSIFNGIWTLAGTPAITLPVFTSANGLPVGLQLVGAVGEDAGLVRTARWLADHLS